MMPRQAARMLPDGKRLHLQDGPIDLVIGVEGAPDSVAAARQAAIDRFATLLDELCAELPLLRRKTGPSPESNSESESESASETGRRMLVATSPFAMRAFITPMAAVAGAGADTIMAAMLAAAPLSRAYVNNGGDIALHLADGKPFAIGMVARPEIAPSLHGNLIIRAEDGIGGIATSGRHGRSFSLGIADAVTVLAKNAAAADAAATMIANRVDLPGHPAIMRAPARSLQPDSDLGDLAVTRAIGKLTGLEIATALQRGQIYAEELRAAGLIEAAALHLACETLLVGPFGYAMGDKPGAMLRVAGENHGEFANHAAG